MVKIAAVLTVFLSAGCAAHFEETRPTAAIGAPPPTPRCISLDDGSRDWGAGAKGSALAAGASGFAALPVPDSEKGWKIGLAAGSLAAAIFGAIAVVESEARSRAWVRECTAR